MGPVTTNPWLIAVINMTIVFGVLAALGVLIQVIRMIDPTQKKTANPVAASAAAPAVVAAVQDDSEIIAVIAAAVAATGCSLEQIACVRRIPEVGWTQNAHIEAISVRKECF